MGAGKVANVRYGNGANVFVFYKNTKVDQSTIQCTAIQNMYLANWTAWQTKAARTMFAFVRPAARILLVNTTHDSPLFLIRRYFKK